MKTIVLHIANSSPVKVDVEDIPNPNDQAVIGMNPRERNDKEFPWVDEGVTTVIFPWWRINYIQVLPDPMEEQDFPELYR